MEENKMIQENTTPSKNDNKDRVDDASKIWKAFVKGEGDKSKTVASNVCGLIFNPYIQNARVKKINGHLFGGGEDRGDLEEAVKDPNNQEEFLQDCGVKLNYTSYPLYRKNRLPSDILTYHHYSIPLEKMTDVKLKQEDESLIYSWRACFKPSYQFRRITSQVHILGKVAYYYRQGITKITNRARDEIVEYEKNKQKRVEAAFLQQLPNHWWKITGMTDKNFYKVSFNFMYFLEAGVDINDFDDYFKKVYNNLYGAENSILQNKVDMKGLQGITNKQKKLMRQNVVRVGGKDYYINPNAILREGDNFGCAQNSWFYWVELPADKCFVFSDQEATALAAPSSLGVFLQAKDLEAYSILQQQLSSLPLNSMVVGEIPFHENNLSGNTNDDFRVTPETMLFFNDLFNLTAPNGTGVQGLPYKNLKLLQFEGVTNSSDIYLKATQQFLISTGLGSLFSLTEKPNEAQVKTSQTLEARYADFIYKQFENFVSIVYDRLLGLNYRWEFHIFGDCFSDDNTLMNLKEGLSLGQSYLFPKYIAMHDYSVEGAVATMEYLDSLKIYDKFTPLANSYTTSGGRPTTTNPSGSDKINKTENKEEGEDNE